MNIFPFTLHPYDGKRLFQAYIQKNKAKLHEQYGRQCLTTVDGVAGSYKLWSYYEVDVEVLSETTVRFTTYGMESYGMESFAHGGRGRQQEVINAACKIEALAPHIKAEKHRVATSIYHERLDAIRAQLEQESIAAIEKELFPKEHNDA